jgi:hypothetical protein
MILNLMIKMKAKKKTPPKKMMDEIEGGKD